MNTSTSDSLSLRAQELIEQWQSEGYNYNEDFATKMKEVKEKKENNDYSPSPNFSPANNQGISLFVSIVVGVALLVGIFYFVYRRLDSKSLTTDIDIPEEDTIYGVDFDKTLAAVEKEKDYYQCIRLKYLVLLRLLNDEKLIHWHLSKTPTQYTFEWTEKGFNDITNIFMMIRYGNYTATEELYKEECALYDTLAAIAKGGKEQ